MKQRYSSLDVKVIAHELSSSLCSLRVANIYDLSTRIFLFKFQKPNQREQLLIDSGFRCHLTSFARSTPATPSPFVVRLRKFLKTRRVTSISQIGTDRIIEFQFSDGLYRLYLEFYAGGNIILTDNELNILSLLRSVDEGPEHERVKVGVKYNLTERQNYGGVPELTKDRVREGLQKAVERQQDATDKKAKKKGKDALRKALAVSITELPPMLVDHAFHLTCFDTSIKPEQVLEDNSLLEKLLEALFEAKKIDAEITRAETAKGYIVAKKTGQPAAKENTEEGSEEKALTEKLLYEDFHPFKPKQFEADPTLTFLEFEGFNKTVDEFFSSIEGQKLESRLQEREENAKRKLEQAKQEHLKRLGGLQQAQELHIRKAEAIQANVDRVQEATSAVNGLIEKGMDWVEIDRLIEREQSHGNPVAQMIKLPLKLRENTVTLLLAEPGVGGDEEDFEGSETESESSEDEEEAQQQRKKPVAKPEDKRLAVDIELGLSPWANAKTYFDQKKSAAAKEERTLEASQRALKSTQKKIEADLKKGLKQEKELLRPVRKQFWFEKFIYFISSDGYLVLGGKDAQQTEILYRRHLKKGDVYVHADLNAAASVIIKNKSSTPDDPIPPSTLSQAGNLSISTSTAWDSKAVMSAWWVNADQVSKTTPSGEYLATGGFIINGKKNYLPPAQLLLGFAVMFQITEESKKNHNKHRLAEGSVAPKPVAPQSDLEEEVKQTTADEDEDSDSDEDFPDAKLESASEESDNEQQDRSNPLQSGGGGGPTADEGYGSESGSEEAPQEDSQSAVDGEEAEEETPEPAKEVGGKPQSQPKQGGQDKSTGKRHLSARERRLLRKGINPPELSTPGGALVNDSGEEGDTASLAPTEATTQISSQKGKQGSLPRGKRGKAKKMAQKYAHQDEEERELALRLLGAKAAGKESAEPEKPKISKEEELQAQKQRRREQHQRAQEKGKAEEERRRAALEGALGEDNDPAIEEEIQRLESVGLDAFTGRPLPGDELVAAIPVCAPWSALATYKYKVKLQPGAQKKGKAVKEILGRWDAAFKEPRAFDKESRDVERIWPKEAELVKAWKETEIYGVVPVSKARVMLSGGPRGGGGSGGDKNKGKKSTRGGRGSKRK